MLNGMVKLVKIEREDTELTKQAVISLEKQKSLKDGTHNTPEVNAALQEIFHGKCYICENQEPSSYQIDHFEPYKNDKDLKFKWSNLFLACAHCNNIKGDRYYPILDCTKVDIDEFIKFRTNANIIISEELEIKAVDDSVETKNTCELLNEVYYGSTPQKKAEANLLRRKLINDLIQFGTYIRKYRTALGKSKIDLSKKIELELKNTSEFTAFKRWIIRDNPKICADFIDCWK